MKLKKYQSCDSFFNEKNFLCAISYMRFVIFLTSSTNYPYHCSILIFSVAFQVSTCITSDYFFSLLECRNVNVSNFRSIFLRKMADWKGFTDEDLRKLQSSNHPKHKVSQPKIVKPVSKKRPPSTKANQSIVIVSLSAVLSYYLNQTK